MAGVLCWMFFSHESQHNFTSKTAAKALNGDLGFI